MTNDTHDLMARALCLGLYGLLARWNELADQPWVPQLIELEEKERKRRSLERRIRHARIGQFKSMADFDWTWPKNVDRETLEDLFTLGFMNEGTNAILLGPNGVGKTMMMRNLAHQALLRGYTACFTTASDMLSDLAAQESSRALAQRLKRYTRPKLLCVDEVGDPSRAELLLSGQERTLARYRNYKA